MYILVITLLFVASGEKEGPIEHKGRFPTEAACWVAFHEGIGELMALEHEAHPDQDFRVFAECKKVGIDI
jgi:hypothetical protein